MIIVAKIWLEDAIWKCLHKFFIQNIGLKEHIIAVHEERDSIVINVAKILLEDAI